MFESPRCPKCGIQLPADAPAGLCPKCLVKAGFESQPASASPGSGPTLLTPPASGFVPPPVEELAPLFPQLDILELLGKGGMGAVYKARQPKLDRLVAVKILPPEISRDPAFAERFQREARAMARLSHPHVVAVYDFGETAGLCYIVMEFVDGANLRQTINAGKLASAEALAIVPQICEALQFAHDEGIVHRDIKPENILIDKRGRVKIADFGLAKLLGQDASDHSLTATHQVMGTLRYMAPEQMQGARAVDHRADIYSLGVVFYELLTGELPMGKFAPPSKKVHVDVRLDEIVLRALEQEPERRYQHASEVKTDVELVGRTPVASLHADKAPKGGVFPLRFPERNSGEPRLSGHALCGASWAAVGLLAAALCVLESFTTPTSVLGEYLHAPARVFGLLALSAPFGTTILGAIAVATIKRSGGKLYGLRLAALDLLTSPLIVIGAVTAYVTNLLAFMIEFNTRGPASTSRVETFAVFGVPGVLVALVVSFFVGRLAWRNIVGGPANNQSFGSKGGTPLGVAVSPDSSSVDPQSASQRLPPIASRPLGPEQISLGAAVTGVVLPTLILIGGILLSSHFSIPDSIVPVCFLMGIGLETVAIGCGFAARGTKSGTAGLIIGLVSLVLWLATLSAITISNHEIGPQPEPTIKGFTDTSTTVDEPMALNDRSLRKEPRRQVDSAVASEPSEANAIRNSSIPAMPGQKPDLVRLERVGHIAVVGDDPFLGLAVQSQYAYLIQGNVEKPKRLHVVDLSELSQPRIVGSAPVTVQAAHLAVAGNYVYVLDEPRLRVFDVSAPAAPHDVGACELGAPLWDVAILGRFAYVTDFASVRVIDLENPTAPKQVGRCEVPDAQGITVVGQYAYIACDIEGLSIVDISNPNAPVLVGRFNGPAGANAVAVAGNHACIAGGEDAVALWIADISNPKEPKSVSKYGDWIAGSVAVQDDVLYLAGGELNILDISEPAAPTRAGSYRDVGFVTIAGENLFVLGDEGFSILRVVRTDQ